MVDVLEINGVKISGEVLVSFINRLTNPDPKRWYRFERKDDMVIVETKRDA